MRTPLFRFLRDIAKDHHAAESAGVPIDAIVEARAARAEAERASGARERRAFDRRKFLIGAGAVAAASFLPRLARRVDAAGSPRIAIIGGGIAGLNAALTLRDAGYASTVYEASVRVGGRMRSDRGTPATCGSCHSYGGSSADQTGWADGQVTDIFGELVDSNHLTIQRLASRFGLGLTDLLAAQPAGSTDTYRFFGRYYSVDQALADFGPVYDQLRADLRAAPYPTLYNSCTARGYELDHMSVWDWIERYVPGGHASPMGMLIDTAYNIEYGAETTDQSSLNMIYMLGFQKMHSLSIFGESDERYRITGGVEQIPAAIGNYLGIGSTVQLGWKLERISQANGVCTLGFDSPLGDRTVTADYVILALPFATLRTLDYASAGFDPLKVTAIQGLGAGLNAKLQLQFRTRYWNQAGPWGRSNGSTYSDTGYQATWESTRGMPGQSGILIKYTGGNGTLAMHQTHPYGNASSSGVLEDAGDFLDQLEPVFPGISGEWNGKVAGSMAHKNPLWRSSYCYLRVGQWSEIAGYERVPQGKIVFAGEHTSQDYQGFMEGAAEEGETAAKWVISALKGRKAA